MRQILAALAAVCLFSTPAAAADLVVDSTAAFHEALNKKAVAGDTIRLAPGQYDGITSKYAVRDFDPPVTIRSADPQNRAKLGAFRVTWKGFTFSELDFVVKPIGTLGSAPFEFVNSDRITIDNVRVYGTLNGDASDDPIGLGFRNTSNIVVADSEFQQLLRGLVIGSAQNVKVLNNAFHDLRSDGADFADVQRVEIRGNTFRNFTPAASDHPDAIQFWTSNTTRPSTDIVIAENLIEKGEGAGTQGIFLRDQVGTLPYERVSIRDNLVYDTGYNGIRVQGGKAFTLERNELVSLVAEPYYQTFLLLQNVDGVVARENRSVNINFGTLNVTQEGNVVTKPVTAAEGAALRAAWIAKFRAAPVEADPRDARIAALEAQVATLNGRLEAIVAQLAAAQADRNGLAARIDALLVERAKALELARLARAARAKNQYLDPLVALLSAPAP